MSYFKIIAMRPKEPEQKWVNPTTIPKILGLCTPNVSKLIRNARSKDFDRDAHFWRETGLPKPSIQKIDFGKYQICEVEQDFSDQKARFQYLNDNKYIGMRGDSSVDLSPMDKISGLLFLPVSDEITGVDIAIAALCGIWLVGTPKENVMAHGVSLTPPEFMYHDIFHFKVSSGLIDYSEQSYSDFSSVFLRNLEFKLSDPISCPGNSPDQARHVLAAFFVCFHEKIMFSLDEIRTAKDGFRDQKQFKGTEAESLVKELGLGVDVHVAMSRIFVEFESFMKEAFGFFCPVIQELPGWGGI